MGEPKPPWSTGNDKADQWLRQSGCDQQILDRFAEVPQLKRKSIILRCMEKPPTNIEAWLTACIRNNADQELEARLTGMASVHRVSPYTNRPVQQIPNAVSAPARAPPVGDGRGGPTASLLEQSGTPSMDNRVNDRLPKLSSDLFASWPHDKSAMLRGLMSNLASHNLAGLLALSPVDQAGVAFAIMVAVPNDPALIDPYVDQWLRRLAMLRGSSPSVVPSGAWGKSAAATSWKVQFIIAGMPTCMSAVTVASVQRILPKLHPTVSWDFCPVLYMQKESDDGMVVQDVYQRVGLNVRTDVTSLLELAAKMDDSWPSWKEENVKFVLISSIGSDLAQSVPDRVLHHGHLHHPRTRWLWGMVSASEALRAKVGDNGVADVLFVPTNIDGPFQEAVTHLWGPPVAGLDQVESTRWAGTARMSVFSTPGSFNLVPVCQNESSSKDAIDDWTGPSDQVLKQLHAAHPTFIPSDLGKLATARLFRERLMTAEESQLLESMQMRHASGEQRLCSRQFWSRWYGFHHTPAQTLLAENLPCAGMIIPTTGMQAPTNLPAEAASPCGRERYCLGCENNLAIMSSGYQTYMVTDILLALMTKCLGTWNAQASGDAVSWTRSNAVARAHVCGDDCPHALK